jgi:hypothetical protein
MCDTQEGQWRLDNKKEVVIRAGRLLVWVVETSISFSLFVEEAMIATRDCWFPSVRLLYELQQKMRERKIDIKGKKSFEDLRVRYVGLLYYSPTLQNLVCAE